VTGGACTGLNSAFRELPACPGCSDCSKPAVEPLRLSADCLLVAPTSVGKTEAAFFALLSRMVEVTGPACPLGDASAGFAEHLHPPDAGGVRARLGAPVSGTATAHDGASLPTKPTCLDDTRVAVGHAHLTTSRLLIRFRARELSSSRNSTPSPTTGAGACSPCSSGSNGVDDTDPTHWTAELQLR
jgi:hypothetical protein